MTYSDDRPTRGKTGKKYGTLTREEEYVNICMYKHMYEYTHKHRYSLYTYIHIYIYIYIHMIE